MVEEAIMATSGWQRMAAILAFLTNASVYDASHPCRDIVLIRTAARYTLKVRCCTALSQAELSKLRERLSQRMSVLFRAFELTR